MIIRRILGLVLLVVAGAMTCSLWSEMLFRSSRRDQADGPPPALRQAFAELTNQLAQIENQRGGVLVANAFGKTEAVADGLAAVVEGGLFRALLRGAVQFKRLDAQTALGLNEYSNAVVKAHLKYRELTVSELRTRFPRRAHREPGPGATPDTSPQPPRSPTFPPPPAPQARRVAPAQRTP